MSAERTEIVTFHGPGAYTKDKKWESLLTAYFSQCGWPTRKFASLPFHPDRHHKVRLKMCGELILWAVVFSAAGAGRRMKVFAHEPCGQRTLNEFAATVQQDFIVVDEVWPESPPAFPVLVVPKPVMTETKLAELTALMEVD